MVTLAEVLASEWGPQAITFIAMGVPEMQILQLFGPQVLAGAPDVLPGMVGTVFKETSVADVMAVSITGTVTEYLLVSEVPVIIEPVYDPFVPEVKGSLAMVAVGGTALAVLRAMAPAVLRYVAPIVVTFLKGYAIVWGVDELIETVTGGGGLDLPFEVDDALAGLLGQLGVGGEPGYMGLDSGRSGGRRLYSAPGWSEKTCTKWVRGNAKQYQAMYKLMKTFTNAEKNGYSMGHRVASVWWSKALKRAKRRSYRAGQRKMQEKMMMYGGFKGMNPAIIDIG